MASFVDFIFSLYSRILKLNKIYEFEFLFVYGILLNVLLISDMKNSVVLATSGLPSRECLA